VIATVSGYSEPTTAVYQEVKSAGRPRLAARLRNGRRGAELRFLSYILLLSFSSDYGVLTDCNNNNIDNTRYYRISTYDLPGRSNQTTGNGQGSARGPTLSGTKSTRDDDGFSVRILLYLLPLPGTFPLHKHAQFQACPLRAVR
jgi:hypothetical protein